MMTTIDKALAGFALGFLISLNQKYGFHFDTGPETQSVLTSLLDSAINGLISGVAVWIAPNKPAS